MNTDKSRNSGLSLNIFYFAIGDTQKDSGLEIEFMLDTGASCSIINYRTFWEICQLQHPISIQKSTKVTKTYSGQTVPRIGYATITFSYDPDGQLIFPLTVWITEMRTQNLLGMDFCQKQVSGIQFDLPGIEINNPPKSICYGSFHQNKSYPHLSQILTIRTPYTMLFFAKSARCWKYLPTNTHKHFPRGSTFPSNRTAVATGLSFINTLYTRSECNLPILMENNKNHQITLPRGRVGFSSLDVVDRDEPKYQIRSPYELTNAIISTDKRYNDCFLLHSTVPAQNRTTFYRSSMVQKTQFSNNPIQLDIAYPQMPEWVKVLLICFPTESLVSDQHAEKQRLSWDKSSPFGIQQDNAMSTTW